MASQTGMEAVPQPMIPKRTGFDSGICLTILCDCLAVKPADQIGIRMAPLSLRGEGGQETVFPEQLRRVFREPAIRIGESPGCRLNFLQPAGRGFYLGIPGFRVDPIKPGMVVAVTTEVHSTVCHGPYLFRIKIIIPGGFTF